MKSIALVDVDCGNLHSVAHIFQSFGCVVEIIGSAPRIDNYDMVVLPGVGSAGFAGEKLCSRFGSWLQERVLQKLPIVGICLGFQLMCEGTEESGGVHGLGFFNGICRSLESFEEKVAMRVGWFAVENVQKADHLVKHHEHYYFNHAFGLPIIDDHYKELSFGKVSKSVAWIRSGNVYGIQFHPEKSQVAGIRLLEQLIIADG